MHSTLSSSTQSVGANNSASNTSGNTNSSLSSPSIGLTNTKVTNSTAKSTGGGNVVSNIPMVSQYIPTGMPFYQQPVYSYEDIQMLQQRIPPPVVSPFAKQKNTIKQSIRQIKTHIHTNRNQLKYIHIHKHIEQKQKNAHPSKFSFKFDFFFKKQKTF